MVCWGKNLRTHNGQYVVLVKVKMNVHTGETSHFHFLVVISQKEESAELCDLYYT